MSKLHSELDDRAIDLLVDQATTGLDERQQQELETLLRDKHLEADAAELQEALMKTAALAQLGFLQLENQRYETMPDHVRKSILARSESGQRARDDSPAGTSNVVELATAKQRHDPDAGASSGPALSTYMGWGVAAALALVLVLARTDPGPASAASQRAELLAAAASAITVPWAISAEPGFEQVSGDVVWSDAEQQGFLRLAGLPSNNPAQAQYQLWIVDPERSAQPVDGGVFDIPADGREFVIPIQAKLQVEMPVAFAITLEQPGGVVVSAGPLLVVAPVGS